jgi:hypothetical protein
MNLLDRAVGLQTDDILILETNDFSRLEEDKLRTANLRSKPKSTLSENTPFEFNGTKLSMEGEDIMLHQKNQASKIVLIDPKSADRGQRYVEQRARGAYIASICQPEASYDMSVEAQVQNTG